MSEDYVLSKNKNPARRMWEINSGPGPRKPPNRKETVAPGPQISQNGPPKPSRRAPLQFPPNLCSRYVPGLLYHGPLRDLLSPGGAI